jgi:succinate-acetate transporter protein
LIAGYVWLAVSGVLLLVNGHVMAGPVYDAAIHAIFLGFIFSMIFGHAPIVFPALLNVTMVFHPAFYIHVVLLHLSLIVRIVGDMTGSLGMRHGGGTLGVLAILLFLVNSIVAVKRGSHSSN